MPILKKRTFIKEYLKRKQLFKQIQIFHLYKFILINQLISIQTKIFFIYYFHTTYSYKFSTQNKNICFVTFYRKSINTYLKLNRMQAISQIAHRHMPGISLHNW